MSEQTPELYTVAPMSGPEMLVIDRIELIHVVNPRDYWEYRITTKTRGIFGGFGYASESAAHAGMVRRMESDNLTYARQA